MSVASAIVLISLLSRRWSMIIIFCKTQFNIICGILLLRGGDGGSACDVTCKISLRDGIGKIIKVSKKIKFPSIHFTHQIFIHLVILMWKPVTKANEYMYLIFADLSYILRPWWPWWLLNHDDDDQPWWWSPWWWPWWPWWPPMMRLIIISRAIGQSLMDPTNWVLPASVWPIFLILPLPRCHP